MTAMPVVGVATAMTRKTRATAFVVLADGTVHEQRLKGARRVRVAQAEAVRFNALAAAHR